MTVNTELAQLSDYAAASTFGVYVLALLLAVIDFAGSSVRREQSHERELVGAGGPASLDASTPGRIVDTSVRRPFSERAGRAGIALIGVGAALNIVAIVFRGLSASRWPLANLYEYSIFLCAAVAVSWLIAVRKYPIRRLSLFVLIPIVILFFVAAAFMYNDSAPVVPALQSYWITIHVTVIVAASGILLFASLVSLLHVIAVKGENAKSSAIAWIVDRLPSAEVLDRVAYRTTIIGFPLFTVGVICGAIWAEAAWGRFWGWDPKETVSFISWVLYAAYLHARATAGWKNINASWINVVALLTMIFNLFIVNFVISGLHSYAGL